MKKIITALAVASIVLMNVMPTVAQMQATGTAALVQGDDIIAEGFGEGANESEALTAAKRDAIEKGIGTILLSQTEIENFMLKRDQIITKTIGSVKSYDVLSKSSNNGMNQIKIKAVLLKTAMRSDLASFHILIESMDKPRTMVVIPENNIGNEEPSNQSAENAVIKFLKDPYEFDLVDAQTVQSVRSSQKELATLAGNAAAAAKLGTQNGAEVIITGSAVAREAKGVSQSLGGMVSVQATVSLRAINCATGRIIASAESQAAKVHISPATAGNQAIAKAAEKATAQLLEAIIKDWTNQQNNGITLSVTIAEVSSFRFKKTIIATLQSMSNVGSVRERNWDDASKLLELDVQYKGNAQGFCDRIDGYKCKDGSGSISVSGQNSNRVALKAQAM